MWLLGPPSPSNSGPDLLPPPPTLWAVAQRATPSLGGGALPIRKTGPTSADVTNSSWNYYKMSALSNANRLSYSSGDRSLKWVSLGWCRGINRALTLCSLWGRITFSNLSSFWKLLLLLALGPVVHLQSQECSIFIFLTDGLPLTHKDLCDYTESTEVIRVDLPLSQSANQ